MNRKNKSREMFDSLAKNALDFLQRSVSELETSPKYSLINFYAATELFLKSRLMLEHWSLIVDEPKYAKFSDFRLGNFKSVGMEEAIQRLKNIANIQITESEKSAFNRLREHRNKLMHFFHPNYIVRPDKGTLESVVVEQCKAWFYLHRLLTQKWKNEFSNHSKDIEELNELMKQQHGVLQAKFEEIRPSIVKGKKRGVEFTHCYYCEYEACKPEKITANVLIEEKCLVCEEDFRKLKMPCPNCNNNIFVIELGEGICEKCKTVIDIDYLIEKLGPYQRPKEFAIQPKRAYCSQCEYTDQPTVIPFSSKWLCLFCLNLWTDLDVGRCEWCGEIVTGDKGDYWSPGCVMCKIAIEREASEIMMKRARAS